MHYTNLLTYLLTHTFQQAEIKLMWNLTVSVDLKRDIWSQQMVMTDL